MVQAQQNAAAQHCRPDNWNQFIPETIKACRGHIIGAAIVGLPASAIHVEAHMNQH